MHPYGPTATADVDGGSTPIPPQPRPLRAPPGRMPVAAGKWERFGPIILVEAYLTCTVLAFAFGPWPWPVANPVKLYAYLAAAQLALLDRKSTRLNSSH